MSGQSENSGFTSWRLALEQGKLSPQQVAVLQDMVDKHQAETLEAAAAMLDWADTVVDPPEHMYGF
jgi:hypothetical protein